MAIISLTGRKCSFMNMITEFFFDEEEMDTQTYTACLH